MALLNGESQLRVIIDKIAPRRRFFEACGRTIVLPDLIFGVTNPDPLGSGLGSGACQDHLGNDLPFDKQCETPVLIDQRLDRWTGGIRLSQASGKDRDLPSWLKQAANG